MTVTDDLFPCLIRDPDNPATVLRGKAKVVFTPTDVFVFIDTPLHPGIALLYHGEVTHLSGGRGLPTGYYVETVDGSFRVTPDAGCGCGTRLKGVRVFNRTISVATS
jgi:hypothetical protein